MKFAQSSSEEDGEAFDCERWGKNNLLGWGHTSLELVGGVDKVKVRESIEELKIFIS